MNIPDPFDYFSEELESEGLTIAERVALGKETQSRKDGAIVPFHPIVDKEGFDRALWGKDREKVHLLAHQGYKLTVYYYRSAEGDILQAVIRFDHATRPKMIKPYIHCGNGTYWFHAIEGQRPLYNLDKLAARLEAPVLVVEGEKAAEAAEKLFPDYVVTTWMSGASSVHRTEMLPLAGRHVVLWPDNDDAGRKAAKAFAAHALSADAASAKIVDLLEAYPDKWDLADSVPESLSAEELPAALLAAAKPVTFADVGRHGVDARRRAERFRLLGHLPGHSHVPQDKITEALAMLDPDMKRNQWLLIARCLFLAYGKNGLKLFDDWSKEGGKYKKGEPQQLWEGFAEAENFSAPPMLWLLRKAKKVAEAGKKNFLPDTGAIALAEIEHLNENHAVVTRGGKTVVLYESYDPTFGRYTVTYLAKDEFCKKHIRHIELPEDDDQRTGKKGTRPIGAYWFGSTWRRQYDHIRFAPAMKLDKHDLNLWSGFAYDPVNDPDGWSKLKHHLLNHVAGGDQEGYDYILNWMAFGVQRPQERVGTALVLVGAKGAGKSIIISLYGALFVPHTFVTSHDADITGKFNARLETTVLLGIEEAFAPQDRKADGILKDLITRAEMRIEDKFFSVWTAKNHLKIIMTSNNDHVVRADIKERRYAVFNVSTPFQDDPHERRRYFGALWEQMENGGYEAMLGELLARDIRGWNPEAIPDTTALRDQKIANLINDPVVAWYHERLQDGIDITTGLAHPMAVTHKWHEAEVVHVPVREVLDDIAHFAKGRGLQFSEHKVKAKLQEFMPEGFKSATQWKYELDTHKRTDSYKAYPFPPIGEARALFTKATGLGFDD